LTESGQEKKMAVINTNVKALFSQMALGASGRAQTVAMQQLSTGKRINSARDDAAGMAIATRMTQQIRSLNQAVRNAGDAISMIQTAEGATNEITDMLQRMRELAVQAVNDTNSNEQRSYLDLEFQQLKQQIVQISDNTEWNGFKILNGSAGERVGEKPVYKTVSVGQESSVFISPNTSTSGKNGVDTMYQTGYTYANFIAATGAPTDTVGTTAVADPTKFVQFNDGAHTYSVSYPASSGSAPSQALIAMQNLRDEINGSNNSNVSVNGYHAQLDTSNNLILVKEDASTTLPASFSIQTGVQTGQVLGYAGLAGAADKMRVTITTANGPVNFDSAVLGATAGADDTAANAIATAINADSRVNTTYKAVVDATNNNIKILAIDPRYSDDAVGLRVTASALIGGSTTNTTVIAANHKSNLATVAGSVVKTQDFDQLDVAHTVSVDESWANAGSYRLAGRLNMTVNALNPTVTATFTTADEKTYTMNGIVDPVAGKVTFSATDADNKNVITQDLTYMIKMSDDPTVDPTNVDLTSLRDTTTDIQVDIHGSIPALNDGDVVINGVTVAKTCAADDTLSPANNAAGSAIAKATAINRVSNLTGVHAVVNENVMAGTAMKGTAVVKGRVFLNGVESPLLTTSLNNPRKTREDVVRALNLITDKTGVTAIDTGLDATGIKLVAKDGRNIEMQFELDPINGPTPQEFAERTGLRSGVHAGTYSLEAKVEKAIDISSTNTGVLSHSGLLAADNTVNISAVNTDARAVVKAGDRDPTSGSYVPGPVSLKTGDLVINGVAIPGALPKFDRLSQPDSYQFSTTNDRTSSAIATASAINTQTALTGVTAVANPAVTSGVEPTVNTNPSHTGWKSLFVNGIEVQVQFDETQKPKERADAVIAAVNAKFGAHGVEASENANGGVTLKTPDGRNISVWMDDTLSAAEFGLADSKGVAIAGVSTVANASVSSTDADTLYSTVSLQSPKPVKIEPGVNGYDKEISNFEKLGFQTGTFGGVVDEATSKMTPPRTGRLSFQVGSSANQNLTIDLADFGKGGPITSDITWDVDQAAPAAGAALDPANVDGKQRSFISSKESATSVLTRLDSVMEKVNATRATMGAVMNRLDHVINNLTNVSMNMSASRSQIEDSDYAAASTELAKTQIMQQAATAVLAQANTSQQSVMKLLGG